MALVRATHLEQWSNTNEARNSLGELLRRLIHAGIPLPLIKQIHFLADEANQLSGWDGILECESNINWIPYGASVWELGTGARQGGKSGKIKDDFDKRLNKDLPDGWDRSKTTYVTVTLRKIDDIASFENELRKTSPWHDVKVIDSTILEEWIAQFLGVETWLQEQGVGVASTVTSLQYAWKEWADVTNPIIQPNLVLVDREKDAAELRRMLSEEGAIVKIKADSPREAIGFMYASIATTEPGECENILNKTIVINRPDDCLRLTGMSPHTVVLRPPATSKVTAVSREGHKVICAFGNSTLSRNIDIALKRPVRSSFATALVDLGLPEDKAEIEARACGASPSIWRVWNQLDTGDPSGELPEWTGVEHAELIVPAILLGGWSDRFEGDKEIIKAITGLEFEQYRDKLQPFISQDDPFLIKIDDTWIVTAPATAFALVINHITQGQLEKFQNVLVDVFSEIDPTIDMQPEERPYASIHGHKMKHSTWLRDGLAETLLRIAVIGSRLEDNGSIPGSQSCQSFVDHQVNGLLGLREDWRLIMSLRDQLPVFAEAAPNPFMDALTRLLQGRHDDLKLMFAEGDDIFGHAFHPSLLWALETLAWEPKYLSRVTDILAQLAEEDPGGRLSNRPIGSLSQIFLPWYPCTSASLQQRIETIDYLLTNHSKINWDLITKLLPTMHGTTHDTQGPKWRDFGRSLRQTLTRKEIWDAYIAFIDRAIQYAGNIASRWVTLIDAYQNTPKDQQDKIYQALERINAKVLSADERTVLWEKLRKTVNAHTSFSEASWALPLDATQRLEKLVLKFAPDDPVEKYSWLFDQYLPDLPFKRDDTEKLKVEVNRLRKEAVYEILYKYGFEMILKLINKVSFPVFIASILIEELSDIKIAVEYFDKTRNGSQPEQAFSRYLSIEALNKFGESWTNEIIETAKIKYWDAGSIVNIILLYPDKMGTYAFVETLGKEVEQQYWKNKPAWVNVDEKEIYLYVMHKFLEVERAADVIELTDVKLDILGEELVYRILEQVLHELNSGKSLRNITSAGYWIDRLFSWLHKIPNCNLSRLARLEYAFLPMLTRASDKKQLALHDLLATEPEFFLQVITDLYKPESREREASDLSDEEKKIKARFAWELLHSWNTPPGVDSVGNLNSDLVKQWIMSSREIAKQKDREKVTDQHIGGVLYYVPADPDDSIWPHKAVRNILEVLKNDEIERGIIIEQFNARGVTSKAMFEGGAQERQLAIKWREMSNALAASWPRTSALCERIALDWEAQANVEDQRAEKDRVRLG